MTHKQLRERFFKFMEQRGHTQLPAASVVPMDDPSVLFTTAGMQQFKPYYTEPSVAPANPVVTIQPCVRTSDIEEVGDERHLTVFEMMGNFAFGNKYFKKEAIQLAYDFILKELQISPDRVYVTVFRGDKETALDQASIAIWRELGISDDKIRMGDREDNFWGPTGETGPCGPTTEIYVDGIEVWNVVFNEFLKTKDGTYQPLPNPGIDTGMGLERLALVMQQVPTVFETDLFVPLGQDLLPTDSAKETRVILDHLKAASFLLAAGVLPSNKDRGYVLRRLIRRAMRYSRKIGFTQPEVVIDRVIEHYGEMYPVLREQTAAIHAEFVREQNRFAKLLDQGIRHLGREMSQFEREKNLTAADAGRIADLAFHMYQSFGFPPEMVIEEFEQAGFPVHRFEQTFAEHFRRHQEVSRAGQEKKFGGHGLILDTGELRAGSEEELKKVLRLHTATHLLQAALRTVVGLHIVQKGSDITAERLRFDYVQEAKLTPEQIAETESLIAKWVAAELPMQYVELPLEEAKQTGALYLAHARYPETVKIYFAGQDLASAVTKEFCGGPHVTNTALVGRVKITKDEALSAGVRRIRAVVLD